MTRFLFLIAGVSLLVAACTSGGSSGDEEPTVPGPSPTAEQPTASPPLTWGPTVAEYDRAADLVADMSVEEQAGQVIVARYSGLQPPTELIAELHLGGVIVMGDNVESPSQVATAIEAMQDAAARPFPLFVGVDQEGGAVARIKEPATEFPAYMTFGAARDPELATQVAFASGAELRALGFTAVFAPVADVTTGPDDPTIGSRSASSDPNTVAETVVASLHGYAQAGIVAVTKHFPGHGSVPADSHEELPVQGAGRAELSARDFVPFRAAVAAGASAVMVAHIDVPAFDPGVPSSLSPAVVGVLRNDLGFDGLVVTDAQDMAAITDGYGVGPAAVQALVAGADVLLMPLDARVAHAAIVAAVADGTLSAQRLSEAATRGIALMLHEGAAGPAPDPSVVGSHEQLSYDASVAGLTQVSGECSARLIGDSIRVAGGNETDRARLRAAAEAAGLAVGSGDLVRLLGGPDPGAGDVVVALDTPYPLGSSASTTARIALYGRTPAAFRALVDVLLGNATGRGTLPVAVDGVDRPGCPGG